MTRRARAGLVLAAALLAMLTGCNQESAAEKKPDVFVPSLPTPPPRPPAYLGDTLELDRIGDSRVAVTVRDVINPATVPNGREPDKTYIAVELSIKNIGRLTITGDANNNVSVVGTDEQTYPSSLATVSNCTNFLYGQFVLAPQSATTGCVAFALPTGVSPTQVRYSPSSGISIDVGVWTL
ncbi:DUF4352 domain-containing protein [Mycolicibacillus koreensis]|nr:DUF4352 domain-containing protein [Mycolicibacillus koreensis]ODR11755.1 hypothetical protein BHQ15_00715 [Mycolicibacillus koreensis]BBY55446.1 hypothetical protein MKOR_26970 [Mycolicibacillus koreensis]